VKDSSRRALESKNIHLSVEQAEEAGEIFRALASPDRLRIIRLLGAGSMNVQQIAREAALPVSTAAAHIRILEDAGILTSESVPAAHGAMKLCSRRLDHVGIQLFEEDRPEESSMVLNMPLGAYSGVRGIQPTCGLVSATTPIGEYDNPLSFYLPARTEAQLLWFRQGFIEYRFGMPILHSVRVKSLELSFEACSEAPMYRSPWKSDITVAINGQSLGHWTSHADLGGRPGRLNPSWWPDAMTQYGYLITWRVDERGSFVDKAPVSSRVIDDLNIQGHDCITVTIGVDEKAVNAGGLNLFGEGFGDFDQALVLKIGYLVD